MLSIVIPARNEEHRIGPTLEAYGGYFSKNKIDHEILVVVNNTTDNTVEVVKRYMKKYPKIRYIDIYPEGIGNKGWATLEGFKEAKGEYRGFVDADMATLPKDFNDLYKNIGNLDGIIASRWVKGAKTDRTFGKYVRSQGFNWLVRMLFLFKFRDTQCGAKIFRKEAILSVIPKMQSMKWAFDVNLLYLLVKNNYKINEYPTVWEDKEGSAISPKVPIQMATGVIRLRLLYSPLKIIVRAYDLFPEKIKLHH